MRALLIELSKIPGLRVWRQNSGSVVFRDPHTRKTRVFRAGPPKGAADISGIYSGSSRRGLRVEVETKDHGKKQTPEQVRWGKFIESSGGVYVLATADRTLAPRKDAEIWRRKIEEILLAGRHQAAGTETSCCRGEDVHVGR